MMALNNFPSSRRALNYLGRRRRRHRLQNVAFVSRPPPPTKRKNVLRTFVVTTVAPETLLHHHHRTHAKRLRTSVMQRTLSVTRWLDYFSILGHI